MLRSANDLGDFSIGATDGDTGQVEAFYFDDEQWTLRYIVVDTALTREEVKESRGSVTERPVSRQHEAG